MVAMSITKRYFTSGANTRSHAVFTSGIVLSSMSHPSLCSAQKSSTSCVSAMPPMSEPAMLRRRMMSEKA